MEGKIVYRGKTKKGNEIIIRYPQKDDAQAMCDYINTLSKEQTFIRFQGEEVSLESETKYLQEQLEKIAKNQSVQLLAFSGGKLMGISEIDMKDKVEESEGVFGISLLEEYRGEGAGKKLMELVIKEVEENIPHLRIVTLGVFANNPVARDLYEKLGFKEYGRLPGGVLYKGQYVDHVYMYKQVK